MEGLKKNLDTYLITGLLVVAAFVIGMLFTEVRYLKKGTPTVGTGGNVVADAGQPAAPAQEADLGSLPPVDESDHVRGAADAQITLIEYSDYECPFCTRFHSTMEQVLEEYDGQVRWVYRHYPLSFHPTAEPMAQISECVAELGGNDAFWTFTDEIFARFEEQGEALPVAEGAAFAAEVTGLSESAIQSCYDSGKYEQNIADEMAGGTAAGVSGTPGTILLTNDGEGELISGALPFAQVQQVIEKYLE